MFIRIKTRKNKSGISKSYAYLVENKYKKRKKQPRQKTRKYLGRVHTLKKEKNLKFSEYIKEDLDRYIAKSSFKTIVTALLSLELHNLSFQKNPQNCEKNNLIVDLQNCKVYDRRTGKKTCIQANNGFLSNYTLNQLINFKPPEAIEREIGKSLGKAIVDAGVPMEHGLFIALFRKIMASTKH